MGRKIMKRFVLISFFVLFLVTNAVLSAENFNNPTYAPEEAFLNTICSTVKCSSNEELLQMLNLTVTKLENTNSSDLPRFYYYRGYLYRTRLNDYQNALKDYNRTIKLNPNNDNALMDMFFIYNTLNDNYSMIDVIKKRIKIKPKDESLYYLCSVLYAQIKDYQNSINYATESIKLKNKNPEAFKIRGLSELELGMNEKGHQDLGYAKRQFLELGDEKSYKQVVYYENSFLNNQIQNTKNNNGINSSLYEINNSIQNLDIHNQILH